MNLLKVEPSYFFPADKISKRVIFLLDVPCISIKTTSRWSRTTCHTIDYSGIEVISSFPLVWCAKEIDQMFKTVFSRVKSWWRVGLLFHGNSWIFCRESPPQSGKSRKLKSRRLCYHPTGKQRFFNVHLTLYGCYGR